MSHIHKNVYWNNFLSVFFFFPRPFQRGAYSLHNDEWPMWLQPVCTYVRSSDCRLGICGFASKLID